MDKCERCKKIKTMVRQLQKEHKRIDIKVLLDGGLGGKPKEWRLFELNPNKDEMNNILDKFKKKEYKHIKLKYNLWKSEGIAMRLQDLHEINIREVFALDDRICIRVETGYIQIPYLDIDVIEFWGHEINIYGKKLELYLW